MQLAKVYSVFPFSLSLRILFPSTTTVRSILFMDYSHTGTHHGNNANDSNSRRSLRSVIAFSAAFVASSLTVLL